MDNIKNDIANLLENSGINSYDYIEREFGKAIDCLVQRGVLQLKPDHQLGGKGR